MYHRHACHVHVRAMHACMRACRTNTHTNNHRSFRTNSLGSICIFIPEQIFLQINYKNEAQCYKTRAATNSKFRASCHDSAQIPNCDTHQLGGVLACLRVKNNGVNICHHRRRRRHWRSQLTCEGESMFPQLSKRDLLSEK